MGPERERLLLVALDDLGIANVRRVRILARLAERTPLPEQVPTLIEADLDRLQPVVLLLVQPAAGAALVELVLFGDQLLDAGVNTLVFHLRPSFRGSGRLRAPHTRGAAQCSGR